MKPWQVALGVVLLAAAAFVAGWAFRAYLSPEAVIDFANRQFFCN